MITIWQCQYRERTRLPGASPGAGQHHDRKP
jgi:hypothetical protein